MRACRVLFVAAVLPFLGGCELLGIETPKQIAAKREADSRAIGAGCRHAGRPIEECFSMNRRADKASLFAGWREMNDYMRENRMDSPPTTAAAEPPAAAPAAAAAQIERDIPARSVRGGAARNGV